MMILNKIKLNSSNMLLNANKFTILIPRRMIMFETITSWGIWGGIKLAIIKISQSYMFNYLYVKGSLLLMSHPFLIGFTLGGYCIYGISYIYNFLFNPTIYLENTDVLTELTNHYEDVKTLKLEFRRLFDKIEIQNQYIANLVEDVNYTMNKLKVDNNELLIDIDNRINQLSQLETKSNSLSLTLYNKMKNDAHDLD